MLGLHQLAHKHEPVAARQGKAGLRTARRLPRPIEGLLLLVVVAAVVLLLPPLSPPSSRQAQALSKLSRLWRLRRRLRQQPWRPAATGRPWHRGVFLPVWRPGHTTPRSPTSSAAAACPKAVAVVVAQALSVHAVLQCDVVVVLLVAVAGVALSSIGCQRHASQPWRRQADGQWKGRLAGRIPMELI